MNYASLSKKAVSHPLRLAVALTFSVAGLILALLSASSIVQAQSGSMRDGPTSGQRAGGEYKPGETPTGQEYGLIEKGEPRKNEAVKKRSDRPGKKQGMKEKDKAGTGSIIDRDPRETSEGSGPDPFGRY